jgi:hypothetical protein
VETMTLWKSLVSHEIVRKTREVEVLKAGTLARQGRGRIQPRRSSSPRIGNVGGGGGFVDSVEGQGEWGVNCEGEYWPDVSY